MRRVSRAENEEERRFIAHELHDELGQMLTIVKIRLATPGAGGAETAALVDTMIERVRKISADLRPLLDEVGLFPALRAHVDAQRALSGVAIELDTEETGGRHLDSGREIACFRVVQEAITNALRHASARHIRVRVVRRPTSVSLSIVDDGRGFDTARLAAASAGHLGVAGMQERVRARGGTFHVSSRPGSGTSVEVEMPIDA
jgi:signal transduction histidine kinase